MFRSLARRAYSGSLARTLATQTKSPVSVADRAQHLLRLSKPLAPGEPSVIHQQAELLRSIPQPVSTENLDLCLKVFDKVADIGTAVDKFSCARLSLMCLNAGKPNKALEPWTRLLEELSAKTSPQALSNILARPDFEPAAMAALAAYFLLAGPTADMSIAQKLVPRVPIPQNINVLKSVGRIDSKEAAEAVTMGLARLRKHVTNNFTTKEFLTELSSASFAQISQLWKQVNMASAASDIPETVYAAFMRRFAETRQTKKSFQVWQQLQRSGLPVSTIGWSALLKTALHAPENSATIFDALWAKMEANGFKPDAACYTEKLLHLTRSGSLKESKELLDFLKKNNLVESRAVGVMTNAFAKNQDFEQVDALLSWAVDQKIELSTRTFNPILQATRGNAELSSKYLHQMTELGIQPDIYTYTFAVDQQMKRGLPVADLLAEMRAAKITPSEQFQTMLAYNLGQTTQDVTMARELLGAMLQQNMRISLVTLGAFVELELRFGDVSRAVQYVEMIQKFGLPPNIPTYNQLIAGALRRREFDVAQHAFARMASGTHNRLEPNVHTYMALLTPWSTADLQNARPVRRILQTSLPYLEKHPEVLDYGLIKQIERIDEHVPELVPSGLKQLVHKKGLELYDRKKAA